MCMISVCVRVSSGVLRGMKYVEFHAHCREAASFVSSLDPRDCNVFSERNGGVHT